MHVVLESSSRLGNEPVHWQVRVRLQEAAQLMEGSLARRLDDQLVEGVENLHRNCTHIKVLFSNTAATAV